jgi:hypothetical protein
MISYLFAAVSASYRMLWMWRQASIKQSAHFAAMCGRLALASASLNDISAQG